MTENKRKLEDYKWFNSTRPLSRHEVWWLIEQAERVEFLEKAHKTNIKIAKSAQEENMRLRESLKDIRFYAKRRSLNDFPYVDIVKKALEGSE